MKNNATQLNRGSVVSWMALIIAIVALVLGWLAYNRSGTNLLAQIQDSVQGTVAEVDLRLARLEAATSLVVLRSRQVANPNFNQFEAELADIRANLRQEFVDEGLEDSQVWMSIQEDFDQVEEGISNQSANVFVSLDELINNLQRNVQVGGTSTN